MTIFLVNTDHSKLPIQNETPLIWTSVLLAEKVVLMTVSASMFDNDVFKNMNEKCLKGFFKTICMKIFNELAEEELDRILDIYTRLHKNKRKTHNEIILYMLTKKALDQLIEQCISIGNQYMQANKLDALLPMYEKGILKYVPFGEYNLVEPEPGKKLNYISELICSESMLTIMDHSIEKSDSTEMEITDESFRYDETSNIIFKIPLLQFPAIYNLESNSAGILRSELSIALKPFISKLEKVTLEINKLNFVNTNPDTIKDIVNESLLPEINASQAIIDSNVYIQQVQNHYGEEYDLNLFLACTSIKNLLELYRSQEIISGKAYLYIKNKLLQMNVIDNCKVLLFLKYDKRSFGQNER